MASISTLTTNEITPPHSSLSDFFNHVFSLSAEDADAMVSDINDEFRLMLRNHQKDTSMSSIQAYYTRHRVVIDLNDPYMDDGGHYYIHTLMEAINREDVQVVEFLLKNGADPNLDDLNITRFVPQSLLMIACKTGNLRIVQLLIQYGAYINIPTDNGNTALTVAQDPEKFHQDIVDYLVANGAKTLLPIESNRWKDHIKQFTDRDFCLSPSLNEVSFPSVFLKNDVFAEKEIALLKSSPLVSAYYHRFITLLQAVISACHCLESQYIHQPFVSKYKRLVQMASDVARQTIATNQSNGSSFVLNVLQYLIKSPNNGDRQRRLMIHRLVTAFPSTDTAALYVEMIARKAALHQWQYLTDMYNRYKEKGLGVLPRGDVVGEGSEMMSLDSEERERLVSSSFVIIDYDDNTGDQQQHGIYEEKDCANDNRDNCSDAVMEEISLLNHPVPPSNTTTTSPSSTTTSPSSTNTSPSSLSVLYDVLTCGINSVTTINPITKRETDMYERSRRLEDYDEHGHFLTLSDHITRLISTQLGIWLITLFTRHHIEEVNNIPCVQKILRIMLQDDSIYMYSNCHVVSLHCNTNPTDVMSNNSEGLINNSDSDVTCNNDKEMKELKDKIQYLQNEVTRLENERNALSSLSCGVV